jgi:NAD(P)-dependent dehydrogenase (short-subunit alcohol dehydrogenase family)
MSMSIQPRFEGKIAVVTGAASGIGEAIVRGLIGEGCTAVFGGDINVDRLKALESELGGAFRGLQTDVTKETDVERLVIECVRQHGGLDLAFNSAGTGRGGIITALAEEDWDFTVDLCLKGVFLSMKHEARQMMARGRGAIINIASLNSHIPAFGHSSYSSAKAGVEMLTRVGALEMTEGGVRVNALLPGLVSTPLTAPVHGLPDLLSAFMERIPMRRSAQPDEIARPALFLAGDDASYISGASLVVDGAWEVTGYPDLRRFSF